MKNQLTIGLEIHAELKTRTKMFCDCLHDPDSAHPNANICAICTGHPGTLPTINKKAVELALKLGIALQGTLFPKGRSKFDRKNYFYPDLPKGYQISQYDEPLVEGGILHNVRIRRIHLEEDAGSLMHAADREAQSASLVDFNRAGTPLMELVTEPDIKSADEAVAFAEELQRIVKYMNVSDADMEKGLMRLEANISIAPFSSNQQPTTSSPALGTKVEVKNINSFKALHDAIEYEYGRQTRLLEKGEKITQETRGWNEIKKETVSQRNKEDAHDYRYFPEPDLPPMDASAFDIARLTQEIPELPAGKKERFKKEYGLDETQARILTEDRAAAEFFEEIISELQTRIPKPYTLNPIPLAYNYFVSDLWGLVNKNKLGWNAVQLTPENFARLIALIAQEKISSRAAKNILAEVWHNNKNPETVMKEKGLEQTSHAADLETTVQKIITENPDAVGDYKKGKTASLQFLIGKAMAALKGSGNPKALKEIFEQFLR